MTDNSSVVGDIRFAYTYVDAHSNAQAWAYYPLGMPSSGDVWHGNIFRCVGKGENRGYLAWQPTETPAPNFHVPEKFGEFEFVG